MTSRTTFASMVCCTLLLAGCAGDDPLEITSDSQPIGEVGDFDSAIVPDANDDTLVDDTSIFADTAAAPDVATEATEATEAGVDSASDARAESATDAAAESATDARPDVADATALDAETALDAADATALDAETALDAAETAIDASVLDVASDLGLGG